MQGHTLALMSRAARRVVVRRTKSWMASVKRTTRVFLNLDTSTEHQRLYICYIQDSAEMAERPCTRLGTRGK
jgi:hypothetical protein